MLKGKELKEGMHVLLVKAPKDCPLKAMTGVPLTVAVVEYPFVVFESVSSGSPLSFYALYMFGVREPGGTVGRTTINVKKCRFKVASEKYVNTLRDEKPQPSVDFPDSIG